MLVKCFVHYDSLAAALFGLLLCTQTKHTKLAVFTYLNAEQGSIYTSPIFQTLFARLLIWNPELSTHCKVMRPWKLNYKTRVCCLFETLKAQLQDYWFVVCLRPWKLNYKTRVCCLFETLNAQLQDYWFVVCLRTWKLNYKTIGLLFVWDPESSITRLLVCCLFETLKAQLQD